MLNKSSVEIGLNLGEVLVDSNKKISAVQGSLLGELSSAISQYCAQSAPGTVVSREDVIGELLVYSAGSSNYETKTYNPSLHDSFMDNYIPDMTGLVNQYLSFARGVVNKEVTALEEKIVSATSQHRTRTPEELFEISYYSLPDLLSIDSIRSELEEYKGNTRAISAGFDLLNHELVTEEGFNIELLLVGSPEEDIAIRTLVAGIGGNIRRYLNQSIDTYRLSLPELIAYNAVNYLAYRNLANGFRITSTETIPSIERKANLNVAYFGASLMANLSSYELLIQNGVLTSGPIGRFSYFTEKTIPVCIYKDSFAKLIEAGSGLESIFGWATGAGPADVLTVDKLINDGGKFLGQWNTIRILYQQHVDSGRLDTFKHLVAICFEETIRDQEALTDAEKEIVAKDSGYIEQSRQLADAYIADITLECLECIDDIALDLVAKIRFRFSNAYELLRRTKDILCASGADEIVEGSSSDPMVASLIASIDYLLDYCLEQTTC